MASNKKTVQAKADAKRAGKRARAWTCIVYPDSENTPENWKEILSEQLVECLISPFHDKDKNPDGELKKPHYHVVLSFKNPTAFDKAQEVFQAIGGVVPPENESRVKDFRQMARYLCHLDQPDKCRYDTEDVVSIGAIDYLSLIMSAADEDEMLLEICDFIDRNQITSFVYFARFAREHRKQWWSYCHSKKSYFIREYIKSLAWDIQNPSVSGLSFPGGKAVLDTGEVIQLFEPVETVDNPVTDEDVLLAQELVEQNDKAAVDTNGRRWCKCSFCGDVKLTSEFTVHGGAEYNRGICRDCYQKAGGESDESSQD